MIGNASFCRPASVATAVLLWGMGAGVVPSVASAAGRVALVVGNGAYAEIGTLPNPGNDAADVAAALGRLGFEVETVRDADRAGMNAALRGFTRRSVGADVALVFYAGHGLEMDGVNYLVPVDARLERDTDVRFEAVALDDVLASVEGAALRVVILDACRNNPLARSMQLTNASRSVSRGSFGELNEDLLGAETLVAYAAAAGTTAADGTGRNSPYTSALLAYLEQPLELSALFRRVRAQVLDATRGEQRPHEYASLLDEHYLRGASGPGTVTAAAQPSSETRAQQETVFWQSIASSRNPADFEAYLQQFPNGVFARLARNRMAELGTGSGDPPMAEQPRPVRRVPVTSGVVVVRAVDARGPGRVHAMSGEIALGFVTGQVSGAARVVTSLGDIDVPKTALVSHLQNSWGLRLDAVLPTCRALLPVGCRLRVWCFGRHQAEEAETGGLDEFSTSVEGYG